MPLDRDHVTIASRLMLPTYAAFCGVYGIVFILDPQGRLGRAASLEAARWAMDLWIWGALWLVLAAVMLAALRTHTRDRYLAALYICRASWWAWAVVCEAAVFFNDDVTFLAGSLGVFVGIACTASIRSLRTGEA